jgi:hypothetical protein
MKVTRRRRQQRKTTKRRKTNRGRKTQKRKGGAPPTIFSPGPFAQTSAHISSQAGDYYNPEDEPSAFYERDAASTIKKRDYIAKHPAEFEPIQELLRQYNESFKETVEAIKQIFHKTQPTTVNVKELLVNIDKKKDNIHELARILKQLHTEAYHSEMAKTPAKPKSLFSRKSKAAPVDTELANLKEEEAELYEATNLLYHEIEDEIIKINGIDGFENYNPLIDTPII